MATTHIPDPGPVNKRMTTTHLLKIVHELHKSAQADLDHVDDMEGGYYWCGYVDAYYDMKDLLTGDQFLPPSKTRLIANAIRRALGIH